MKNEIEKYIAAVTKISDAHFAANLTRLVPPVYRAKYGRKYAKIIQVDRFADPDTGEIKEQVGGSTHSFVEIATGNIYKAASWAAPAKHARGNVMSEKNGGECLSSYGAVCYLRG